MAQDNNRSRGSGGGSHSDARNYLKIATAIEALKGSLDSANAQQRQSSSDGFPWVRRTGMAAIAYTVLTAALLAASGFTAYEATIASSAATRQATIADDAEKRQLRAYVGLIPGSIENFGDQAKQHFVFTRKNYGQTPAYDVAITEIGHSVGPYGQPLPLPQWGQPPEILRGNVTLFPTSELPMNVIGVPLDKTQLDKVITDDSWRYTYAGTIKYRDAFDKVHFTNFCWIFKRGALGAKDAEWCQGHNDSD